MERPNFVIRSVGDRHQVIETATNLIWRTLDTRRDAADWLTLAEGPSRTGKVKTR